MQVGYVTTLTSDDWDGSGGSGGAAPLVSALAGVQSTPVGARFSRVSKSRMNAGTRVIPRARRPNVRW
jgi:hypothetical protein